MVLLFNTSLALLYFVLLRSEIEMASNLNDKAKHKMVVLSVEVEVRILY